MKRGAEKQLTKDDDDDIEEIQDHLGFQQADESTLAKRQIRALPKRALAASKPPALNGLPSAPPSDIDKVEAVSPPRFGGFVGFGARASASNPFTFASQPTPPAFDTASKPTPDFPTLVSPFGALKTSPPDVDTFSPKPATSTPTEETDAVTVKYFKSLRGLNVSFLSAISAAVEKDPFFDVGNLIESYKNLRTTIQSEFDESPSTQVRDSGPTNSGSLFGAKVPSEKSSLFSMPKPPAEVSTKPALANESGTKTGGFTFPPFIPPTSSSPAGFTHKSSETTSSTTPPEASKPPFTFGAPKTSASTSSPTSCFSFATPPSVEDATSKPAPPSSQETELSRPPSTAPSFGSTSVPNFFTNTKPTSIFGTSDATSKPTSVFGGSIFGGSGSTDCNKPSPFTQPLSDGKDSSKANTPPFGNVMMTPSSASTNIFGSPSDKPASFFGSASQPKTSGFTFGKPGGSIGNPVGFGFGSSSPSAGDTITLGSSGSGFNFGVTLAKPSESLFSPPPTDKSTESTPQPDGEGNEDGGDEDASKLLPSHTHDEEGEGEEDEETTHVIRCKVYRLSKSEDKNEWKDLGIGMFRLKKHKITHVRRALMRNSNTGRILINFRIYAGLKPSLAKTSISFIGYENNTPASFRLRVKNEDQAVELKQALERDIAAV